VVPPGQRPGAAEVARRLAGRERWAGPALLLIAIAVGAALRIHLALTEDGLFWPDEVFQSLEPAHRLVYGYGFVTWEFIEGARNFAFPGLVAAILAACRAAGIDEPRHYLVVVRLVMAVLAGVSIAGVYSLATALGTRPLPAAVGALAFALAAPAVYLSFRAGAEVASTAPILFGLALAIRPGASRRAVVLGASLLGLAVLFRLQNAFFCAIVLGVLAFRRDTRGAVLVAVVLAGWALILGGVDRLTWGGCFHSAITYLRFNASGRVAEFYGSSPPAFYLRNLLYSLGPLAPPLGLFAALSWRRAPTLLIGSMVVVGIYSLLPHKELRFIFPIIGIGAALAAVGLDWTAAKFGRRAGGAAIGFLMAGAVGSALTIPGLTFGDLGQYGVERGLISAYDHGGPGNRLLLAAHDQSDLCGLRFDAGPIEWSYGYSALHRQVPFYPSAGPPSESGFFNYVIAPTNRTPEGTVVASEGGLQLVRLDRTGCVRDPGFSPGLGGDPLRN